MGVQQAELNTRIWVEFREPRVQNYHLAKKSHKGLIWHDKQSLEYYHQTIIEGVLQTEEFSRGGQGQPPDYW